MKVHLDTDIGGDIDDLCALALVLAWPDVEIVGVTTVAEHAGKRAGYVRYALALAGRTGVPVAAGAEVRIGRFVLGTDLPPEHRYWPQPVPAAPGPLAAALDLLERSIDQDALVVAIGPFTNLACLEHRSPGILRTARLCLMGGSIFPGHPDFPAWTYADDYNVQADPAAARDVLEAATTTLVPIQMTAQTALRRAHLAPLADCGPLGSLIAHQARAFAAEWDNAERYVKECPGVPADLINFQHDPLACAVALGWDGVEVREVRLALEMRAGCLVATVDDAGRPHRVVTAVDGPSFNAFWLAHMQRLSSA